MIELIEEYSEEWRKIKAILAAGVASPKQQNQLKYRATVLADKIFKYQKQLDKEKGNVDHVEAIADLLLQSVFDKLASVRDPLMSEIPECGLPDSEDSFTDSIEFELLPPDEQFEYLYREWPDHLDGYQKRPLAMAAKVWSQVKHETDKQKHITEEILDYEKAQLANLKIILSSDVATSEQKPRLEMMRINLSERVAEHGLFVSKRNEVEKKLEESGRQYEVEDLIMKAVYEYTGQKKSPLVGAFSSFDFSES